MSGVSSLAQSLLFAYCLPPVIPSLSAEPYIQTHAGAQIKATSASIANPLGRGEEREGGGGGVQGLLLTDQKHQLA